MWSPVPSVPVAFLETHLVELETRAARFESRGTPALAFAAQGLREAARDLSSLIKNIEQLADDEAHEHQVDAAHEAYLDAEDRKHEDFYDAAEWEAAR